METVHNLLTPPGTTADGETFVPLLQHPGFTLEHIVSRGAASPEGFWFDQDHCEWVLLLQGDAVIRYDSGEALALNAGDSLTIPARCRHRVEHCSTDAIWLALHYQEAGPSPRTEP